MKTTTKAQRLALLTLIALPAATFLVAQGPLTPPGAPAPTMRTLDQIEPRIPISTLPFSITTPGQYYVTKSITTTATGISISSDDVVLDLGGFTLVGDGGTTDFGIVISSNRVTVRNGTLRAFSNGVRSNGPVSEIFLEDLALLDNTLFGYLNLSTTAGSITKSVFRRLQINGSATAGLRLANIATIQNVIEDCNFIGNSGIGLEVNGVENLILRCKASGNGTNYSIRAGNRGGIYVLPATNPGLISGTGGPGSGTTDPFANLSF